MSASQLKNEIHKTLENIPEDVLEDVLTYLQQIERQPKERVKMIQNLRMILQEDQNLLHRLAK
jgi:hypothetical protein